MDNVVHDDEPAGSRGVLRVREPGVQQHSHVVVPGIGGEEEENKKDRH